MRVLHVIPSISRSAGGPSAALRVMESAAIAEGITVETATTDDDGPGQHTARALGSPTIEDGVTRWYFHKDTEFYKCSWGFARWIARNARDYDVIHVHALFSFTSNIAAWTARRRGVPYVVRPLGVLSEYGMTERRSMLKRLSLNLLERRIVESASAVHFTSDKERVESERLGLALRSTVIPLALSSLTLPAGPALADLLPEARKRQVILFLSRLDPKKNVEGLLGAFARTKAPNTVLVVAGTGSPAYEAELIQLAQALGISSDVVWPGHVQGQLKAALLREARAFVLASHSENFAIAVAEALAAGIPCVVGRGVALADHVTKAGVGVVVDADATSIADGLRRLLSLSESERVEMGDRARAFVQAEFAPTVLGRRLRELYESVRTPSSP